MAYTTPLAVAKQLGKPALANDPVDEWLQFCVDATDFYINDWCGLTESITPTPAGLAIVAKSLAVDFYKQPDATFGVIGAGETGMVRIARDLLNRYDSLLIPFYDPVNGWGVA
jgi:hypothetical protein